MSKPTPLEYDTYYHIYNRGNNRENIFFEEKNFAYFLDRYAAYIEPVADTYAYLSSMESFPLSGTDQDGR